MLIVKLFLKYNKLNKMTTLGKYISIKYNEK